MGGRRGYEDALVPALRRVDGVCLIVSGGRTRAEVYGIGHRHSTTVPVSLTLATRLVEGGAPLTVRLESSLEPATDVAVAVSR